MIVLLVGPDDFSRNEAFAALKAQHNRDGALAQNTTVLDARNLTLEQLRAAALTVPFLAEFRLVRVDGLCARIQSGARPTSPGRPPPPEAGRGTPPGGGGPGDPAGGGPGDPAGGGPGDPAGGGPGDPAGGGPGDPAGGGPGDPAGGGPGAGRGTPPEAGRGNRRKRDSGEWDALPDLLAAIPPTTLLLFLDDEANPANPIRRAVAAGGEVREFPLPRERDLVPWITRRAQTIGLSLMPGAGQLLAQWVGAHLWVLASELEKLKTYAAGAAVDEAAVRSLVAPAYETTIFRFVDAVAEGRPAAALNALALLRGQEEPQRIISMLARQFRLLIVAREILDQGGRVADVQQTLALPDFVARRVTEQARRFRQPTLDAAIPRILQAEVQIQNYWQDRPGGVQQDLAVELLVADLAGVGRARPASAGRRP